MQYLSHFGSHDYLTWSETLRDRSHVLIRPAEKADAAAQRAFIDSLPETGRFRFLGQIARPVGSTIERSPAIGSGDEMTFVAVTEDADDHERIVGISRYRTAIRGLKCECMVMLDQAWQDKALGAVLMRHLLDIARSEGFRSLYAIDAADNTAMSDLAGSLGFRSRVDSDDSRQLIHELEL